MIALHLQYMYSCMFQSHAFLKVCMILRAVSCSTLWLLILSLCLKRLLVSSRLGGPRDNWFVAEPSW